MADFAAVGPWLWRTASAGARPIRARAGRWLKDEELVRRSKFRGRATSRATKASGRLRYSTGTLDSFFYAEYERKRSLPPRRSTDLTV